uniref:RING-type domain-containing protein n=1 Tax=Echinostoma caproni TaxID=27848 RepID=A0A183A0S8_9TREM
LCHERGLVAADLILALPKGGDRMKDSVQYRAFPKQFASNPSPIVTDIVLHQIHNWIAGVLAERVRLVSVVDDVVPSSVDWSKSVGEKGGVTKRWIPWLTERPKPIHVIWFYNRTSVGDQTTGSALVHQHPPLVLSALSVPFTGRVRFWISESIPSSHMDTASHRISGLNHWPAPTSSALSITELLNSLECPENLTYLIVTPEAKCLGFGKQPGEYLSYPNLELYLRLLYPSVDDVLLASFFLLNLLVVLNTAIRAGKLIAVVGRRWMGIPVSYTREHLGLIQSFIQLARQGWTLHRPSRPRYHAEQSSPVNSNNTTARDERTTRDDSFSVKRQVIQWGRSTVVEFFSHNLFFLLTVLPVINALSLSQAACFLNLSLWVLRTFVLLPPVVSLRVSIVEGHFCWLQFFVVVILYYLTVLVSAAHVYFVLLGVKPFARSRQRAVSFLSSRRLSRASPDELLNQLTRSLLISDLEPQVEHTASSTSVTSSSSLSELDPAEVITQGSLSNTNHSTHASHMGQNIEQTRLLRRLGRLHSLLHEGSHYLPTNSVAHPEDAFEQQEQGEFRPNLRAAPAHIYTWQCSPHAEMSTNLKTESISIPSVTPRKSQPPRRFTFESMNTCGTLPATIPIPEAEYEAEDEDEIVFEQQRSAPRQSLARRLRCHRRRFRMSQLHVRESSSSDNSIREGVNSSRESSSESKSHARPTMEWPPWVIPCEECVVCWRVFRPGVRLGALPCGHGFHEACIRRWLDTGALDCPVCRWPAHAPHLRQQRQMIGQLLNAVQSTLNANGGQLLNDFSSDSPLRTSCF